MTPQELKNSVLEYAFSGNIQSQQESDEPAQKIVGRILLQREKLISQKLIKKEKYNPQIDYSDELPSGWCVTKLGSLTAVITKQTGFDYSKTIKPNLCQIKRAGTIPMVQTKNFKGKSFSMDTDYYISEEIAKKFPKILLDGKCLLLSIVGASIGNVGYYDGNELAIIGGAICKVKLVDESLYDYLFYYLQSPFGQQELKKNIKATAQGTITVQDVREILIKLPPIAEQKRIVAKIEEILPLIDRYEVAWTRLEAFNKRFPQDMQKAILQQAIQGKLVEQRPEEGTAEALYQQIQAERQALIKAKKIKKDKPLPEITDDEKPFDIPESWKWARIGDIFVTSSGTTPSKSNPDYYSRGKYNWVRTTDLNNSILRTCEIQVSELALSECRLSILPRNSVCIAMYGGAGTIGKNALIDFDTTINQSVCAIHPNGFCDMRYLQSYIQYFRPHWMEYAAGSRKDPNINKVIIRNAVFPLPPLAEQKRIVAKIEQLLPLCERLK